MPRPPLPIGTYGNITTHPVAGGGYCAVTRFRDHDGVTRKVKRTGPTAAIAKNRLREDLRDRARHPGTGFGGDSRFRVVAEAWIGKHSGPAVSCGFARDGMTISPADAPGGGVGVGFGSGWGGVGWHPGPAEDRAAQGIHRVEAVLGGGREVAADAEAVGGALLAGEAPGDLLLDLGRAQVAFGLVGGGRHA